MAAHSAEMQDKRRLASVTGVDEDAIDSGRSLKSVYVYEAPVRLWHWVNALAITVLCLTGYFIGRPLPTMPGEASEQFLMGYIRFVHFAAGYILAIGLLGRAYWALVGNHYSREIFWLPIWSRAYWKEVLLMLKWYAFLAPRPSRYVAHNPMARFAMFFGYLLVTLFMILSGFALYSLGTGMGSWQDVLFGWMFLIFDNPLTLQTWHRMGLWAIVIFVVLHIYAAIREDILGRQGTISTMFSGYRTFRD
ncbi:Ni/Fe-hydrogenase, b-type cytochrome subunit [Serpentinimonas barnesii]|uniref:Ni/Fe-hydrogenase, b-type cytochrome subunit n=1 Tax=Serpentinimonas barnesii TaxID=1458427 RepID=UPI000497A331|nr:Ni/Fe-hydrogenase, b-type cytochrome subunit [Serpentinimonas barnesii]